MRHLIANVVHRIWETCPFPKTGPVDVNYFLLYLCWESWNAYQWKNDLLALSFGMLALHQIIADMS
jgi:hypothetical protein